MATSTGTVTSSAGPLDVGGLVSKLMTAEGSALTPLTKQASSYNSLISAYGTLKSTLSTYQTAIDGLSTSNFSAQKTAVTNNGTGATLTTDPLTAEVNADNSNKVLAQKIQSPAIASTTLFNAGDSLAIKIGKGAPKFITLEKNSSLTDLRDAINAAKAGVSASITNDSSGSHLVLESNTGGSAGTMKVQAGNSLAGLAYDPSLPTPSNMTQVQGARDATSAVSGSYSVSVSQLAQAQKISSAGFAEDASFDTGILAIKTGKGATTVIKPLSNSLSGIRDAINASDAEVTASLVSDGKLSHLVIATKETGADNTIRVSGTGSYAALSFDPSGKFTSNNVNPSTIYDASAGGLTLTVDGTATEINLGGGGTSLADVSDAINAAKTGVSASISNEDGYDHLVLTPTGDKSGSALALTGTGSFASLSGSSMGQMSAGQDAKLNIDGVAVTSASNKVTDAISGLTLNLTKTTTPSDNFTLSVTNDTTGVTATANTFITAYNTLAKAVAGMTQQTPSTQLGKASNSSPLASETSVQSMMSQLRNALFTTVKGGNGISSLSDIGISVQKDGTLALDAGKLSKAVEGNFPGLTNLFTATPGVDEDGKPIADGNVGVLTHLQSLVKGFLADGGIIDSKTKGLQASLKINSDRQTAINSRLSNTQDRYTNQFNSLNTTLASMTATQSYLSQQLANLPKASS
jgi:flagellar hook-associated protein 2